MNKFREENMPQRTCTKKFSTYSSYKPYLRKDFSNRCGYTNCNDFWFGGATNFHIDHFIPWKNYPEKPDLKTDYNNLIYCCSYVNILKSNDEKGFLDPTVVDFNLHFTRDAVGNIIPNPTSIEANLMFKKLKFYLKRYQVIWMLDKILDRMKKIKAAIESTRDPKLRVELIEANGELGLEFTSYLEYLEVSQ